MADKSLTGIRKKVVADLNKQLDSKIGNCESLYVDLCSKKASIESALSSVSDGASSRVVDATKSIQETLSAIEKYSNAIDKAKEDIASQTLKTEGIYDDLKKHIDQIHAHEKVLCYLNILDKVQHLSDCIENEVKSSNIDKAIGFYKKLCNLCLDLITTECHHLLNFLKETVKYWHNILKTQLSMDLDNSMKALQWPFVNTSVLQSPPSYDSVCKFQNTLKRLLLIQLPSEIEDKPVVTSSIVVAFPVLTLPIVLLLRPLKKRFAYHFSGSKPTNRLDKPEWYFTQILTWIRDHEKFIMKTVQPMFNELEVGKSAIVEFMCGLVQFSVDKLICDIDAAQYDDSLFSHIVDEVLGYEKELHSSYSYPSNLPGPLSVLTQAQLFVKWIKMEKKYAHEKMDAMLSIDSAWTNLPGYPEEDKVTEVAHVFLNILSTMSERYSILPQPGHRLQFVELELELLDDFRVSLLQVLRPEREDPLSSKIPAVMNTISYVILVLDQWQQSPNLMLLQIYKNQSKPDEEAGGLFDSPVKLLKRLEEQLQQELANAVMLELKARSRPYRKDRWFSMKMEELELNVLTPSACPMFQILADQLHSLHVKLSKLNFSAVWKSVAQMLNWFLIEELVLENTFCLPGAKIFQKDIEKCLIPLFSEFTHYPQSYFCELREACMLLTLPEMKSEIKRACLTMMNTDCVKSLGMKSLSVEQAISILRQRVDIVPELM